MTNTYKVCYNKFRVSRFSILMASSSAKKVKDKVYPLLVPPTEEKIKQIEVNRNYHEDFGKGFVGQTEVIRDFLPYLETLQYELKIGKRHDTTFGAFLLVGPTGTGKGEFARNLAKTLHGSSTKLLTIACNEYTMDHDVAKLAGANPGFVGFRETVPILAQSRINAVSTEECPVSIILWDEIEKASPKLFDVILNILDRATYRLGDNTNVSFDNTIHIFTSNLGNQYGNKNNNYITGENQSVKQNQERQMKAIKGNFRPEFLNRIDKMFYFQPFSEQEMLQLFRLELSKYFEIPCQNLYISGVNIVAIIADKTICVDILQSSESSLYGARELKRQIRSKLGNIGLKLLTKLYENPPDEFIQGELMFTQETKSGAITAHFVGM